MRLRQRTLHLGKEEASMFKSWKDMRLGKLDQSSIFTSTFSAPIGLPSCYFSSDRERMIFVIHSAYSIWYNHVILNCLVGILSVSLVHIRNAYS